MFFFEEFRTAEATGPWDQRRGHWGVFTLTTMLKSSSRGGFVVVESKNRGAVPSLGSEKSVHLASRAP